MSEESSEQEGNANEAAMRRQWMTERQQMMLAARKAVHGSGAGGVSQAEQLAARMAKLQKAYRAFNGTFGLMSAASFGTTLLITCLVMNGQLILGNGFKVRYVPPLTFPEILILAMVDLIVGIILLAAFAILAVIVSCAGWTGTVQCAWVVGWDAVKALWLK